MTCHAMTWRSFEKIQLCHARGSHDLTHNYFSECRLLISTLHSEEDLRLLLLRLLLLLLLLLQLLLLLLLQLLQT